MASTPDLLSSHLFYWALIFLQFLKNQEDHSKTTIGPTKIDFNISQSFTYQ